MPKKYEKFVITPEGLPSDLVNKLDKPWHVEIEGNPLTDFVQERLIPKKTFDVILLESFQVFYKDIFNLPDRDATICKGIYLNLWGHEGKQLTVQKDFEYLKEKYNLDIEEKGIFLPLERKIKVVYWTLVHEMLHDVFNNLPNKTKKNLLKSATTSYQNLQDMLALTEYDITPNLQWPDFTQNIQMKFIDEFISYFFTNDKHRFYRFSPQHMPKKFKKTLRKVGYKIDHPPLISVPLPPK